MHQDLYCSLFGSGALVWVTITEGGVFEQGKMSSEAYLFNKAVSF